MCYGSKAEFVCGAGTVTAVVVIVPKARYGQRRDLIASWSWGGLFLRHTTRLNFCLATATEAHVVQVQVPGWVLLPGDVDGTKVSIRSTALNAVGPSGP